ncbi:hypothetical protein E2C01_016437 [Portunus trituberculatus]|uniref:Uncharacterized protein n=1 Tax=Portunus trituberculatus TaxID=210409 RepID=A0A5B7DQW9_PORTR|nr:hypothetical protein [Portunus trituberculatus]
MERRDQGGVECEVNLVSRAGRPSLTPRGLVVVTPLTYTLRNTSAGGRRMGGSEGARERTCGLEYKVRRGAFIDASEEEEEEGEEH